MTPHFNRVRGLAIRFGAAIGSDSMLIGGH